MNDAAVPPPTPRRRIGALLAVAVLGASAAAGFFIHRLMNPVRPTLYATPVGAAARIAAAADPAGAAAPPRSDAVPVSSRRVPDELPGIALAGLDGVSHALTDYRGKLLLINFWATWCEPCRREIPLLKLLRRERAKDGLEIVGIAIDSRDSVAGYATQHGLDYPLLVGETGGLEAANAFGTDTVLPFSVFADRRGRVVALKVGELHPQDARMILDRLVDLDQGRLTLSAAQQQIAAGIARLNAQARRPAVP